MSSIEGGTEVVCERATISGSCVVGLMIRDVQLLLGELGPWHCFSRFSQTFFKSFINLFSFSTICPPRDIESEQFPQAGSVSSLIHQWKLHREFLLT